MGSHHRRILLRAALAAVITAALAACGASNSTTSSGGAAGSAPPPLSVLAGENFWGSIAAQLGGTHVSVKSIVTNPDTDPHSYEPTPANARTAATAQYVVVNGIGYDPWLPKLLAAQPAAGRKVLTVGTLVGVPEGGNPHRWYSPKDVMKVIDQITSDYKSLDGKDAGYFDQQHASFVGTALAKYNALLTDIKTRYAGAPVGASESIFAPMADALGLNLLTPPSFLKAISEGSDVSAADKATIDGQIKGHQIRVYVFNSQNSTPDVAAQVNEAKAAGIPTTTITETLIPPTATFQDWQADQLQALEQVLAQATGK
jgi:zinc/manganese transport system substrate-binding protein